MVSFNFYYSLIIKINPEINEYHNCPNYSTLTSLHKLINFNFVLLFKMKIYRSVSYYICVVRDDLNFSLLISISRLTSSEVSETVNF